MIIQSINMEEQIVKSLWAKQFDEAINLIKQHNYVERSGIHISLALGLKSMSDEHLAFFLLRYSSEDKRKEYLNYLNEYKIEFIDTESYNDPQILRDLIGYLSFGLFYSDKSSNASYIHRLIIATVYYSDDNIIKLFKIALIHNHQITIPYHFYKKFIKRSPRYISVLFFYASVGNNLREMKRIYLFSKEVLKNTGHELNIYYKSVGRFSLQMALQYCNTSMVKFLVRAQNPSNLLTKNEWHQLLLRLVVSGKIHMAVFFIQLCRYLTKIGVFKVAIKNIPSDCPTLRKIDTILINTLCLGHIPSILCLFRSPIIKKYYSIKKYNLCPIFRMLENVNFSKTNYVNMDEIPHPAMFLSDEQNRDLVDRLALSRFAFVKKLAESIGCKFKIPKQETFIEKEQNEIETNMGYVVHSMENDPIFDVNVLRCVRMHLLTDDIPMIFPDYAKHIENCSCDNW